MVWCGVVFMGWILFLFFNKACSFWLLPIAFGISLSIAKRTKGCGLLAWFDFVLQLCIGAY